jgi:hypothetical protein
MFRSDLRLISPTFNVLHVIATAIQDQFADKLIVDDRIPIHTYRRHHDSDATFVLLSPNWEIWKQLVLVRICVYVHVPNIPRFIFELNVTSSFFFGSSWIHISQFHISIYFFGLLYH